MNKGHLLILITGLLALFSCKQPVANVETSFRYVDKPLSDTVSNEPLMAVFDKENLQYGVRVAYVNEKGDTIIPFGKYAYLGTDTLRHYANVMENRSDQTYGKWVAIDRSGNVLYDIFTFDNGPDEFKEGLVRVIRNGKMGFANAYGQVVIPCIYDFAWWFEQGKAKVTFKAIRKKEKMDEYTIIESDEWFYIDKSGNKIQ